MALSNEALMGYISSTITNDQVITRTESYPGYNPEDAITGDQYTTVLKCTISLQLAICLVGIPANLLTVQTFTRMGLGDTMTIAFFNLSLSDLAILIGGLGYAMSLLCDLLYLQCDIALQRTEIINQAFLYFTQMFCGINELLTAFLALQRCLCVVIPLHFKGLITKYRCFIIMALIWLYGLLYALPLTGMYIQEILLKDNSTEELIGIQQWSSDMLKTLVISHGTLIIFSSQVIVLVSLFFLVNAIRKSTNFRMSSSAKHVDKQMADKTTSSNEAADEINLKAKCVTMQAALVSAIFIVTCVPDLMFSIAEMAVPGFYIYSNYHYTYLTTANIAFTCHLLNSSVNFIIYYNYNSKFKQIVRCNTLLSCCFK